MICLNNTDTIEAGASVDAVVDYTIHGLVSGAFTVIASGQLSDTDPTVLYTATENISIVSMTFVNTHSATVDINLYIDSLNAGSPRRIIPKNITIGINYSLHYDGQRLSVMDDNGALVTSLLTTAANIDVIDINDYYTGGNVEVIFDEIGETRKISGWDLTDEDTLCDIAFDIGTRTITCSVKAGQSSYHFWADSKKIIKTGDETVVIPAASSSYYIYFDNSGDLQYVEGASVTEVHYYEYCITAWIYWNADKPGYLLGNEQHGKLMSPRTHHYNHSTYGSRYESGMDITGLSDGGSTYTNMTSGFFWDEDIRHTVVLQEDIPFLYRLGTEGLWRASTLNNNVSHLEGGDTYHSWNEWTGSTWQLTEAGPTDYWIMFTVAIPAINFDGYAKIIGQNVYPSRLEARNAIESELSNLTTEGLPSQEFVFLQAYIVERTGTLVALANGDTHVDLRIVSGGTASSVASPGVAADITIADAGDIITAVNVEDALQENRTAIDLNTAKNTNVPTTLSTGTVGVSTYGITSDGGVDDVVIAASTNAAAGVATAAQITNLEANTSARHTQGTDTALGVLGTKATPIDADKVIQRDSADSDEVKTSTWTQIKAFLKTYFDSLYNLYTHPNHSGDVTSAADGAQIIADDAVTYVKIQNVTATDRLLGRDTEGAGVVEEISPAAVRTMINVEDGSTADQTKSDIDGLGLSHDSLSDVSSDDHHAQTHATTHVTGGADVIANVVAAGNSGLMTGADKTKLNGIETAADVTNATNVNSAGAIMHSDITPTEGMLRKTASETYTTIKTSLNAIYDPGTYNDTGDGYSVSSLWVNIVDETAFICLDDTDAAAVWKEITLSAAVKVLTKGFHLGGNTGVTTSVIEDLIFEDETSQVITATLDTARSYGVGVSSSTKGYVLGGQTTVTTAVIEDLIFSNETSQAITATLDTAKKGGSGVSSSTKGYILGGTTGSYTAVIEDLIFSSETSQAITATLDTARGYSAGVNSSTKGYILGGTSGSSLSTIEDLIFSGETSQVIAATLDTAKRFLDGVSSSTKGYILGGLTSVNVAVIEDLIFSGETSQAITATLDTAKYSITGINSSTKGYSLGGVASGVSNIIEDLIFSDETSQAITATLNVAKNAGAGVQG